MLFLNQFMQHLLRILPVIGFLASLALGQASPIQSQTHFVDIDSGEVANNSTSPATAGLAQVVWSRVVTAPDAAWVRLVYAGSMLSGDGDRGGNGSYLRITSMRDGYLQTQHRVHVGHWSDTSAYFNGDSVLVEILAHQGTGPNRLIIKGVIAGPSHPSGSDSICGPTDDRQLSNDARVARLMPIGCTGWLINDCNNCFLTAGHCTGSLQVVQFNVPLSTGSGSTQNPPPSDQYAVDNTSLQSNGGQGTGNDWAYFGVQPNSTTGLTAFQAQGNAFNVATPPPVSAGLDIRITGNGSTSSPVSPTWYLVQKTHVGPFVTFNGSLVQYQTDTTGGNSGSPVILENTGEAIGIHTHGGCGSTGGQNSGTGSNNSGLQAALANPLGVCECASLNFDFPNGRPTLVNPDGTTTMRVTISASTLTPIPGTRTRHSSSGGAFTSVATTQVSPDVYDAIFPALPCLTNVSYYVSAQSSGGLSTEPSQAPNQAFETIVARNITIVRDFDFNSAPPGWGVTNTNLSTGAWVRGTPATGGTRGEPASDFDGSGQCWITGNTTNEDVDDGPTALTTEIMNLSTLSDPRVTYTRWITNDDGDDFLTVDISENGGTTWVTIETIGDTVGWNTVDWRILDFISNLTQVRIRWSVADQPNNSVTEAGLDAFRIYDVACDQASWTTFGSPCLGTFGVPVLSASAPPALGTTFLLTMTNVGAGLPVILTGLDNTSYSGSPLPAPLTPFGFGVACQLHVRPDVSEILPNFGGTAFYSLAIPNDPSLGGLPIFHQGLVFAGTSATTFGSEGILF